MQQTQVQLKNAIQEKNTLKLLGVPMSKQSYNGIVWILILALSVLLVILFLAFKRGHAILKSTRQELNELKDTFEAHRIRAREREEKMARKHLDEVLKYKSKMGIN
jgi:flagellar biosynthesis/type III secretory pathway M-ring protein FliF/YscJ